MSKKEKYIEKIKRFLEPEENILYGHYDIWPAITYLGGHPPWGMNIIIGLILTNKRLMLWKNIEDAPWSIFFDKMKSVSIEKIEGLTATRVILLGILAPLWKKKKPFLLIEMENDIGEISSISIGFSKEATMHPLFGDLIWGLNEWFQNISNCRYQYLSQFRKQ